MGTFTTADGKTKVSFKYEATTTKIQAVVGDCAEALFDRGLGDHGTEEEPKVFADLSNQDKLDLIDEYIKKVIVNTANAKKLDKVKADISIEEHVI